MEENLRTIFNKLDDVSRNVPGMSVYVISKKDNIEIYKTYGYANLEKKIPVTRKSKWMIQSVSKNVYATTAAWLVGQKKASFSTNIHDTLKNKGVSFVSQKANELNTAKNGLGMTTGLPGDTGEEPSLQFQSLKSLYKTTKYYPLAERNKYIYVNMGYTIGFDTIMTEAGYSDFETPMYEFAKLINMPLFVYPTGKEIVLSGKDIVLPYVTVNNKFEVRELPTQKVFIPADGIVCTVDALAEFVKFHLDDTQTLIPKKVLRKIYKPLSATGDIENQWYGMGTRVYQYINNSDVNSVYGHAGAYSEGLFHKILYNPYNETGVVVLTNTISPYAIATAYYTYFALTTDIQTANREYDKFFISYKNNLNSVLNPRDFSTRTFPIVSLDKLIGTYYNQLNGYVKIYKSSSKYYAIVGNCQPFVLCVTTSIHGTIRTVIESYLVIISPFFRGGSNKGVVISIDIYLGGNNDTYVKVA